MVLAMSDDDYWRSLEFQLGELRDLFAMRIETKTDAVGERRDDAVEASSKSTGRQANPKPASWAAKTPLWNDEFGEVRPWLLVPYVDGIDYEDLRYNITLVFPLLEEAAAAVANRHVTPKFLAQWGALNYVGGQISTVYGARPTVGHARSAMAGGQARKIASDDHKRWFAHYFLRVYRRGNRADVEEAIEELIRNIIDRKVQVNPWTNLLWFHQFLDLKAKGTSYRRLRPAFNEDSLSIRTMRDLVAQGSEGLPPVDLEFREP